VRACLRVHVPAFACAYILHPLLLHCLAPGVRLPAHPDLHVLPEPQKASAVRAALHQAHRLLWWVGRGVQGGRCGTKHSWHVCVHALSTASPAPLLPHAHSIPSTSGLTCALTHLILSRHQLKLFHLDCARNQGLGHLASESANAPLLCRLSSHLTSLCSICSAHGHVAAAIHPRRLPLALQALHSGERACHSSLL